MRGNQGKGKVKQMGDATVESGGKAPEDRYEYKRGALRGYDFMVFRVCAPFCWRCPTDKLIALYDERASARHLDIGVGTGYLMSRGRFPVPDPEITLMDLDSGPLEYSADRLRRFDPKTHQASVLEPWGFPPGSFESIAMCNLLHCVPGAMPEKSVAFRHAREALAPGGWLFGSTVLGKEVEHTRLSRRMMRKLNERRIFFNLDDGLADLEAGLNEAFDSCEIEVQGAVALFAARG